MKLPIVGKVSPLQLGLIAAGAYFLLKPKTVVVGFATPQPPSASANQPIAAYPGTGLPPGYI